MERWGRSAKRTGCSESAVVVGRCNLRHAIRRTSSSGVPTWNLTALAVSIVRRWLHIDDIWVLTCTSARRPKSRSSRLVRKLGKVSDYEMASFIMAPGVRGWRKKLTTTLPISDSVLSEWSQLANLEGVCRRVRHIEASKLGCSTKHRE